MTYRIMGTHDGRTEEIDTADSKHGAEVLAAEYRLAFGAGWSIRVWLVITVCYGQ